MAASPPPPGVGYRATELFATWFGCGRSPIGPGTVGSLGAWPLYLGLRAGSPLTYWLGVLGIALAGTWAAQRVADRSGDKDPSRVVIDEVAGALIALGLAAPFGLKAEVLAMVLFRVLDIYKPGWIARAERVRPAGVGIMLDDLLAGALAGGFVSALPWPG